MEGTSKENNSVTELQPMEGTSKENSSVTELTSENFPTLIKSLSGYEVPGFDISREPYDANGWLRPTGFHPFRSSRFGLETMMQENKPKLMHAASISMPPSPIHAHDMHAASISMPPSPTHANVPGTKKVLFRDDDVILGQGLPRIGAAAYVNTGRKGRKPPKFFSQPMPKGSLLHEPSIARKSFQFPPRNPRTDRLRDGRYDSFKTWSGKLERQISTLRGRPRETDQRIPSEKRDDVNNLKVDRYYDALEGPELDKLRASEESILPEDHQWPFLLRFPISSFGICLGVSSQAIMWKTLATSPSISFLHVSIDVNLILWCIAVALVLIVAIIYSLKLIFYFEAVRREYYHPIRVNFFFAPWIALLFLALGVPPSVTQTLPSSLWYILMTPIFFLELKIYGQWMSGGQRRLSKVANPSNHLSVVGNFVGALLGASMGLKEGPIFFFAIGLAHYTVLFVTLYQRLPTNETLPKELHPVFFLFVAAPSVASMAWARIQGSFDYGSRIAYFIAMFLYFSLAVRVNFFRGFRFSLAWWAYTFPMTGAAIATIRYTNVVTNNFTRTLTVVLCLVSTLTVASLLVTTIIHAFVLHDLFPNDIAIAISHRKPKTTRGWFHKRSGSSDNHSIEKFLKYVDSDGKDVETGLHRSASEPGLSGKVEKVFAES